MNLTVKPRALRALSWACALCVWVSLGAGSAYAFQAKPFGIKSFTMQTTSATRITPNGTQSEITNEPYTFMQAGGHPWALTTAIEFENEEFEVKNGVNLEHLIEPTRDPKDVVVDLPPGLLGNPMAVARCTLTQVLAGGNPCPSATQVGVYRLRWFGGQEVLGPIVDVKPERGQSAEFAFENEAKVSFLLTGHLVRTAQGYGFAVVSNEIPSVEISRVETTFWGVPADPSHTPMRGRFCSSTHTKVELTCKESGSQPDDEVPAPFLTMPADCAAGPLTTTIRADSWEEPGSAGINGEYRGYAESSAVWPGVTGCDRLQFQPHFTVEPDTLLADEPVGLGLNLEVPLNEVPASNATPQLRDTVVTLPEGLSVSPGVVDGIRACEAFGPEGINITGPESEEAGLNGELQLAPGHCPRASTVGSAEAFTPLLPVPVQGNLYLARPGCGGVGQRACTEADARDGNLYRLYLELGGTGELADTGVHFKVAFETEANPATGQLTTKVLGTPQAPFSDLKIHLNRGPRAPLANPAVCGGASTTTDLTPWSGPGVTPEGLSMAGTADATPSSEYEVQGCSSTPPFKPGFLAGTVTPNAGRFSSFTMSLSRADREQYVKGIQLHTPPGLLAMLSSVPLCPEDQANDPSVYGECAASKIGTVRVSSGAGSHPFEIEGSVYLTGPHDGAPFGLSIVTHAVAGPFDLGLIVVRARIDIDPENSTARVTTDETGPYAVPQIIFGVPLRLQRVTVNIDRPGFMFNPTNCGPEQITANVSGAQNALASVSSPFAASDCKSLAFKPTFKVSISGKTSRRNGESLDAKLSYPKGAMGVDANIAKVKVSLPKQLPSRLTTLQKACPAAIFQSNAASCPPASIVGIAKATTPLLPVALSGPVYFVSHGGEAFPSLIVVLQGDGVRVDLTGSTFINKAGITSSTFKTVPDVPVDTFELYLPEGPFSALAANGSPCKQAGKLVMPTEFTAQNGAVLEQSTKIGVTGCAANKAKGAKARSLRNARTSRGAKR
jgi:hypothetical protein